MREAKIIRLDAESIRILNEVTSERKKSDWINVAIQEKYLREKKEKVEKGADKLGAELFKV